MYRGEGRGVKYSFVPKKISNFNQLPIVFLDAEYAERNNGQTCRINVKLDKRNSKFTF